MSLVTRAARRVDQLPWRRYWISRGVTYEAEGGGFLVEPGSIHQLLQARNANLSLLDDLDGVRCVIALGDPGLGKSRELESYAARVHERFRSVAAASGGRRDALLSFDLKDFDNRDSLLREVFQAPAFEAWKADATSGARRPIFCSFMSRECRGAERLQHDPEVAR